MKYETFTGPNGTKITFAEDLSAVYIQASGTRHAKRVHADCIAFGAWFYVRSLGKISGGGIITTRAAKVLPIPISFRMTSGQAHLLAAIWRAPEHKLQVSNYKQNGHKVPRVKAMINLLESRQIIKVVENHPFTIAPVDPESPLWHIVA